MAKWTKLDEKAKKALENMCRAHNVHVPLGEWLGKVDDLLAKLDADTGVADTDYESTLQND